MPSIVMAMHGNDRELSGPRIVEALRKVHEGAALLVWTSNIGGRSVTFYCVTVCPNDDAYVSHPLTGEKSQREIWQRDNHVVAFGREINRVLHDAARGALRGYGLTIWFDRVKSQYHFGPRGDRYGSSGEPAWADAARQSTSVLALPPGLTA